MFRRNGAISRSFHSAHGVTVNGAKEPTKIKRKFSWSSSRLHNIASEILTHRPVVLKEGFLCKPTFFRFGGRRRRWCVLRTYTQTEASIDIYSDESKTRYKGSISLDKEQAPIMVVKNADSKRRRTMKQCYLSLKVGKNSFHFTADSFRELKEWCALIRQAMDNGNTFSGKVTEPNSIEEGMLNVKFNCNCIALLCPLKEVPLKTWRLDRITSFGQSGGILTFESCGTCSDPEAARCSINVVQEKPSTMLNIMEKAIRNNPNTGEIHYERSILGDIYHCDHDCSLPRFLVPAHSDPNLYRSASASPQKGMMVPVEIHHRLDAVPSNTLESNNDSGLPGTPQPDALSISSSIPSPTGSHRSPPSFKGTEVTSPYRSPAHSGQSQVKKVRSMSETGRPSPHAGESWRLYARRQSDESSSSSSPKYASVETQKMLMTECQHQHHHHPQLMYAMISHDPYPKLVRKEDPISPVPYATVKTSNGFFSDPPQVSRERYDRLQLQLQPVDEPDHNGMAIYDEPCCEPCSNPFSHSPSPAPVHQSRKSSRSSSVGANSSPTHSSRSPKISVQCTSSYNYPPGSDVREREEDFEELPPRIPKHKRRRPPVKELVKLNGSAQTNKLEPRARLHSTSEILDPPRPFHASYKQRGSMEDLRATGVGKARGRSHSVANAGIERHLRGSVDFLARLQEEEERLSKVLDASKKERSEELLEAQDRVCELNRRFKFSMDELEYDEPDPDTVLETCSNLADYQRHVYSAPSNIDKVLTKVANNSVHAYAYKIAIPLANTEYDVPRSKAPVPDLRKVRSDAPPKPIRFMATEQVH